MDGIDVALIHSDGQSLVERGPSMSFTYTGAQRDMLRQAIRDAALCKRSTDRPGRLADIEQELTEIHGAAVSAFLRKNGIERDSIDVVGFHGHTVAHRPDEKLTVQLGDGRLLADLVRCPVVYDLRQQDVLAGGQGAPLAPIYHQAAIASVAGINQRPIAVLNIGGVANVTWIGRDNALMAFDTGPGNALLDDWISKKTGKAFDDCGGLSASGNCDSGVLAVLMDDDYFNAPLPKSLDRDYFSLTSLDGLSAADGGATLTEFTAKSIALAQDQMPEPVAMWLVTGGGRHNSFLIDRLKHHVKGDVRLADAVGLNGDSMEAEAWGYLAVRSIFGLSITFPGTTGVPEPMTGGSVVPRP